MRNLRSGLSALAPVRTAQAFGPFCAEFEMLGESITSILLLLVSSGYIFLLVLPLIPKISPSCKKFIPDLSRYIAITYILFIAPLIVAQDRYDPFLHAPDKSKYSFCFWALHWPVIPIVRWLAYPPRAFYFDQPLLWGRSLTIAGLIFYGWGSAIVVYSARCAVKFVRRKTSGPNNPPAPDGPSGRR